MVMMQDIPAREGLATLDEATRLSGINVHSLRGYIKRGRLRSWQEKRHPFRILVSRAEVVQLAEDLQGIEPREG